VETPEEPRESTAARLGKSAEAYGLAGASWVGRGDDAQGLSILGLAAAAGAFVCLFMPWVEFGGNDQSGWFLAVGAWYGLLALALVLVEVLFLARAWASAGSGILAFCLSAAAGLIGLTAFVNLRWGSPLPQGFSVFAYGAWLGLVFAVLLILLAALRLVGLWRSAP
jgi:hypothetical protein